MFSFLTGSGTPRDAPAAAPEASTRSSARMSAVSVEGSVSQNPRRLTKRRSKGKMSISPVARAERSVRPSLRNSLVVPEETIFEEAPQSVVAIGGVRLKAGEPAWMREVGKADVFTRGVVTSIESRTECVVTTDGGAQLTKKAADLYPANAPSDAAPDHCALIHLSEPCILDNSRVRYERNDIYTFTGRILVALNPFQSLPIYGDAMMKRFSAKSDGKEAEPHVYAIGELAYARMRRTGGSQAVVMSGESGAGKTETTKHLMRYLTQRASRASELEAISTVILQANPITEAFGNAKTQRNNNSSRFGKFIKIHFGQHGAVTGASLTTYLLERSRVTQMASDERSYHIFYQARRQPRATRAPAAAAAAAAASRPLLSALDGLLDEVDSLLKCSSGVLVYQAGGIDVDDRDLVFMDTVESQSQSSERSQRRRDGAVKLKPPKRSRAASTADHAAEYFTRTGASGGVFESDHLATQIFESLALPDNTTIGSDPNADCAVFHAPADTASGLSEIRVSYIQSDPGKNRQIWTARGEKRTVKCNGAIEPRLWKCAGLAPDLRLAPPLSHLAAHRTRPIWIGSIRRSAAVTSPARTRSATCARTIGVLR